MKPTPRLSVAIPLFNEEEVVPKLVQRAPAVPESLPGGPLECTTRRQGLSK